MVCVTLLPNFALGVSEIFPRALVPLEQDSKGVAWKITCEAKESYLSNRSNDMIGDWSELNQLCNDCGL